MVDRTMGERLSPNDPGWQASAHTDFPIVDQPPPVPSDRPAVWDLVIADMRERDQTGRERYGTPLQPFNGRDALVDAYQESLDRIVYLRQAIEERAVSQIVPTALEDAIWQVISGKPHAEHEPGDCDTCDTRRNVLRADVGEIIAAYNAIRAAR